MRKVKCTCGCHENPAIIHIKPCCENGYIDQSNRFCYSVELHDEAYLNIPDAEIENYYKAVAAKEIANNIIDLVSFKVTKIPERRVIELETYATILTDDEYKTLAYKLNELRKQMKIMGLNHSQKLLFEIVDILS